MAAGRKTIWKSCAASPLNHIDRPKVIGMENELQNEVFILLVLKPPGGSHMHIRGDKADLKSAAAPRSPEQKRGNARRGKCTREIQRRRGDGEIYDVIDKWLAPAVARWIANQRSQPEPELHKK